VDVAEPTDDRTGATTTPEEGTDGSEPADADSAAPEGTGTQPDVAESEPETFDEEEWISVHALIFRPEQPDDAGDEGAG
jgi:hypothetical protein